MKLVFPRKSGLALQAVLVNTAGGITGGDAFSVEARAGAGTALTLTSQAAERAYRAQPGETGRVQTRLTVEAGARLNWLPQETILYRGCALRRSLTVDLAPGAALLLAEPLVFGRAAMGERLTQGGFRDRIEVRREGRRLFLDAVAMQGDIAGHLAGRFRGDGAGAMVSLLYIAADAEAQLPHLRAMLPASAGASLIREDLLFLRALAPDSHLLRATLLPVLNRLTGDGLPRPWMI